jgi:hypothetical protein
MLISTPLARRYIAALAIGNIVDVLEAWEQSIAK